MYTEAILVACAAVAAAAPASEAGTVHVPVGGERLAPRSDGTVDMAAVLRQLKYTLAKHGVDSSSDGLLGGLLDKRAVASDPLVGAKQDVAYYGKGSVGATTPQTFTIDFDTGSSDFFVPGPNCKSCKGTPYDQGGVNRHKKTSVTYGSGSVSGNDYFDTVCIAGLCAPHTNVISLTNSAGFSSLPSNSLMGMGFSSIAESGSPTFFERLMALGKVTKPEFSFYLGRQKSGTSKNSLLTLGGVDSSRFTGKATKVPVSKKGYWQVAIDGTAVTGSAIPALLTSGQGAIDTGTSLIIAPIKAATGIALALGAVPIPLVATGSLSETAFAFDCGTKDRVSIVMAGKKYEINPLDLSIGKITSGLANGLGVPGAAGLCFSAIIGANVQTKSGAIYIVGDSFLKNWYSTFSYAKGASVSFAKSV